MTMHGSATALEATPHANTTDTRHASGTETPHAPETIATEINTTANATETNASEASTNPTISDAVRRRAQAVINDDSIDPRCRAMIRYALEVNDQWLPELVRRTEAGQSISETIGILATAD